MNSCNLEPLPLGTSDFAALRSEGQIYVDKTALIYEIASKRQKFFLSRPRRFGKSLLISTFESLFKYGLRDFKGLAIEKLWKDIGTYKVVRLDFSEVKPTLGFDKFKKGLGDLLEDNFSAVGFKFDPNGTGITSQLSKWLKTIPKNSLVLLIDEYDAPLTSCLNNSDLFEDVRAELSDFYSRIKSNDGAVRFFFMTGITKFSKPSIFSELNMLTILTMDPMFGTLLGYTEEELKYYFKGYLDRACEVLNFSEKELLLQLRINYDGFCFDEDASTHVYAPWSTLNFLNRPSRGFQNYWYESGGQPRVLLEYIKSHSVRQPSEYENEKKLQIDDLSLSSNLKTLDDNVLLTQAGYLTIKSVKGTTVTLDYPNKEVSTSMARFYAEIMLSKAAMNRAGEEYLVDFLTEGKVESVVQEINRIILGLDYKAFPLNNEANCRSAVYIMIDCTKLTARNESHNALGRSDLEVRAGNNYWIFEFKYCRDGEDSEALLQKAVEQIQSRHYGEQVSTDKLTRVALVFSEKERQFVYWKS